MQTERAYLSRHMEQLAERLSQEEILCDEEVDEDDEELKKLKNEKVNIDNILFVSIPITYNQS